MSTTEENTEVAEETTGEEAEEEVPLRFEVHAVKLTPQRDLEDFAEEYEQLLNDVADRGAQLQQVKFIQNRGVIVVVDTEVAPRMPSGLIPIPLSALRSMTENSSHAPEAMEVDERLQKALRSFNDISMSLHLQPSTEKEREELKKHLEKCLGGEGALALTEIIENCQVVIKDHEDRCGEEGCSFLRVMRLTQELLEETLRSSIS